MSFREDHMQTLRVGVIGCGFFGRMHAQVLGDLPRVDLVAVSDVSEENLAAVKKNKVIKFRNYKEMLEREDVDAVHICVPDRMHTGIVKDAIVAGKHIFVEKPLTDDPETSREIYELSRDYPKKIMVGYILRFNPSSIAAYETIRRREIGEIIYVSSRRVSPVSGGLKYGKNSSLAIHSCVHDIDLARWLVGSEYSSVYSKSRFLRLKEASLPAGDAVLSIYQFENGVIYSQENAWVLSAAYPVYVDGRMDVIGTNGSVHLDFFSHGLKIYRGAEMEHPDLFHWPLLLGHRGGDLREEIAHFVDAVLENGTTRVTCWDGYVATVVADKVQQSIEMGREMSIHYR